MNGADVLLNIMALIMKVGWATYTVVKNAIVKLRPLKDLPFYANFKTK